MDPRISVVLSLLRFRFRIAIENTATRAPSLETPLSLLPPLMKSGRTPAASITVDMETTPTVANRLGLTMTLPG